jgi:uncharacterized membrane protein HdeD (DUF308 family)
MADRLDPGALSVPRQIRRHPWWVLVPAILFIALGAAAVLMPRASTIAVNVILGWLLLLSGAVYAWSAFGMHGGWQIASTVALAALSILVGLLLLAYPLRVAITLTLVLGVFFLVGGAVKLYSAIRNRHVRGWWWGGVGGIASLAIAGLVFAGWPGTGTWILGVLVGVDLIFSGATLIALYPALKSAARAQ